MTITPLHEVRDTAKLNRLADDMRARGWVGRPVLALDCGDHLQAITGTHRLAAAALAGIDPETYEIKPPIYTGDNDDVVDLFSTLIDSRNDERAEALRELVELGAVEHEALMLMEQEEAGI